MKAILGEKLGMTQIFDDGSRAIPVTIIKAGPVHVTQIKRPETDGYAAIQIAYKEIPERLVTKPVAGHFAKAGVAPARHVVEVHVDDPDEYTLGQEIKASDLFVEGGRADVAGFSKGKGFSGSIKRHNFKGQGASHGAHKIHRAPGSIGAAATPSRVHRGKRMPGRMGGAKTTVLNLDVVKVDAERHILMLRGAVPGPKGAVVVVREAVKASG